jgi:iron only hydrogenase large subunit-like protein
VPIANKETRNDDGLLVVDTRSEYCIDCGGCVSGCTKNARVFADDTEKFINDLHSGKRMSIVFAPAFKTHYPNWRNILGYLKNAGNVNKIYDTSFGAEITTWAYLKFITESGKKGWVSQPCPVVVNFIERYEPDLLPLLIPIHSPAMCTAVYMRKYENINDPLVFLSPCFGKKSEFERYGNFQYNVTYKRLMEYFQKHGITPSASSYEPDSPPGEFGSFYPAPGGLKANVSHFTNNTAWVHQVEGVLQLAEFLRRYKNRVRSGQPLPLLVDALNCLHGCNGGTAVDHSIDPTSIDSEAHKLVETAMANKKNRPKKYKHFKKFNKQLNLEDFKTSYSAKRLNIPKVTKQEVERMLADRMLKKTKFMQEIDCRACGYDTCYEMAEMCCREINVPDNCVHFLKEKARQHGEELERLEEGRIQKSEQLAQNVREIAESIAKLSDNTQSQTASTEEVLAEIEEIVVDANKMNEILTTIEQDMKQYNKLTKEIVDVADQTNILSLNASVEAARAGQHGKGFAVVAEEVRKLAAKSKEASEQSIGINEAVQPELKKLFSLFQDLLKIIDTLRISVDKISQSSQENMAQAEEISAVSEEIASNA